MRFAVAVLIGCVLILGQNATSSDPEDCEKKAQPTVFVRAEPGSRIYFNEIRDGNLIVGPAIRSDGVVTVHTMGGEGKFTQKSKSYTVTRTGVLVPKYDRHGDDETAEVFKSTEPIFYVKGFKDILIPLHVLYSKSQQEKIKESDALGKYLEEEKNNFSDESEVISEEVKPRKMKKWSQSKFVPKKDKQMGVVGRLLPDKNCHGEITMFILRSDGVMQRMPPDPYLPNGIKLSYNLKDNFLIRPKFSESSDEFVVSYVTGKNGDLVPHPKNNLRIRTDEGEFVTFILGECGSLIPVREERDNEDISYSYNGQLLYKGQQFPEVFSNSEFVMINNTKHKLPNKKKDHSIRKRSLYSEEYIVNAPPNNGRFYPPIRRLIPNVPVMRDPIIRQNNLVPIQQSVVGRQGQTIVVREPSEVPAPIRRVNYSVPPHSRVPVRVPMGISAEITSRVPSRQPCPLSCETCRGVHPISCPPREIPVQHVRVPIQQVRVPIPQREIPVQQVRVPIQQCGNAVQQVRVPIQQCGNPVQQVRVPIQQCGNPVQQVRVPIPEQRIVIPPTAIVQGSPNPPCDTPCRTCNTPCRDCNTPCRECNTPCRECNTPCRECNTPCRECNTPCRECDTPCRECNTPCKECDTPCRECDTPCQPCVRDDLCVEDEDGDKIYLEPEFTEQNDIVLYKLTCKGNLVRFPSCKEPEYGFPIHFKILLEEFVMVPVADTDCDVYITYILQENGDLVPCESNKNTFKKAPGSLIYFMLGKDNVLFPVQQKVDCDGSVSYYYQDDFLLKLPCTTNKPLHFSTLGRPLFVYYNGLTVMTSSSKPRLNSCRGSNWKNHCSKAGESESKDIFLAGPCGQLIRVTPFKTKSGSTVIYEMDNNGIFYRSPKDKKRCIILKSYIVLKEGILLPSNETCGYMFMTSKNGDMFPYLYPEGKLEAPQGESIKYLLCEKGILLPMELEIVNNHICYFFLDVIVYKEKVYTKDDLDCLCESNFKLHYKNECDEVKQKEALSCCSTDHFKPYTCRDGSVVYYEKCENLLKRHPMEVVPKHLSYTMGSFEIQPDGSLFQIRYQDPDKDVVNLMLEPNGDLTEDCRNVMKPAYNYYVLDVNGNLISVEAKKTKKSIYFYKNNVKICRVALSRTRIVENDEEDSDVKKTPLGLDPLRLMDQPEPNNEGYGPMCIPVPLRSVSLPEPENCLKKDSEEGGKSNENKHVSCKETMALELEINDEVIEEIRNWANKCDKMLTRREVEESLTDALKGLSVAGLYRDTPKER